MRKLNFKDKKTKGIIIFLISLLFYFIVCYFLGIPILKYAKEPEAFRAIINEIGFGGEIFYIFLLVFQIIFAFIPGEPFELLAGYTFGAYYGTFLCLIGTAIGSTIVFFISKKFGTKIVEIFFTKEKINSLKILNDKKKMYFLFFVLFFIPGTPKDLLSYVAGLTPINYVPYILITTFAKLPSIVTSTIGGDAVGDKKYLFAIITFAVTALISLIGLLIYRRITKNKS